MHSERTLIHLQHMIERACAGNTGEEKEITGILFDEAYALIQPFYGMEKSDKVTKMLLKKYISKLNGRHVLDVHEDICIYVVKSLYITMIKNNEEVFKSKDGENISSVSSCLSDDNEFYDIAKEYCKFFEGNKEYDSMPDNFKNMQCGLMILMELYCYQELSIEHIVQILDVDEKIIKYNILQLKKNLLQNKKLSEEKAEKEEKAEFVELFSNLNSKVKICIDICIAVIIMVAGFIIFS